ncbi:hypothetical protein KY284_024100 [Solanum tuberosum]|nr:hypothetical protein KY284_024100 [Solanum tuberosum]
MIRGGEEFDSKLLGYIEPIHKALDPPQIIFSKEKSPLDIDPESGQPSNAKQEVKEKRKRKKKQSSNADGDSWLPARWEKIVKYHKMGKLAGYSYKLYKDLAANKTFRLKKEAKAYIEEQKLFEADRNAVLQTCGVHSLILDTTYCDPQCMPLPYFISPVSERKKVCATDRAQTEVERTCSSASRERVPEELSFAFFRPFVFAANSLHLEDTGGEASDSSDESEDKERTSGEFEERRSELLRESIDHVLGMVKKKTRKERRERMREERREKKGFYGERRN